MHIPCPHVSLPSPIQNLLIFEPFFMCLLQNDNFFQLQHFLRIYQSVLMYSCAHEFLFYSIGYNPPLLFWYFNSVLANRNPFSLFPRAFVSWSPHSLSTSLFFGIAGYTMLSYSPSPGMHHFPRGMPLKIQIQAIRCTCFKDRSVIRNICIYIHTSFHIHVYICMHVHIEK